MKLISQTTHHLQHFFKEYGLLTLLSLFTFFLTRYAITNGAGSDPRYTLIVSQSILENGTIQLNAYQSDQIWGAPANFDEELNILKYNGRYYNYFPLGPSLFSLPFIVVSKAVGWDMRLAQDNINAQRLLASLTVIIVLWLVYLITRLFLSRRDALMVTAVSFFGSTLISTLGIALWSLNFSVIFIGLSLWLILRYDVGQTHTVHPFLLGFLLFCAFFCRAAAAAFILPVFLYLLLKDWRQMLQTAVSAATLLALFLLWSQQEFGTWLPIYYSVARLQVERSPLWLALAGHLVSPSRGLFIFMPFLLLLIPALLYQFGSLVIQCRTLPEIKRLRDWEIILSLISQSPNLLIWFCLLWIALHLFVASRASIWWGGHSFGPRILTELMLAFTLLTAIFWQQIQPHLPANRQRFWRNLYLLLGVTAVFIHSYQGLYNYSTAVWNSVISEQPAPPLTSAYGDLFNWHIPQFQANNSMLCRLEEERTHSALAQAPLLTPYAWGTPLTYDADKRLNIATTAAWLRGDLDQLPSHAALFLGWEPVDNDRAPHRAAACETLHILFKIEELPTNVIHLIMNTAAFGHQPAIFSLNGQPVGEWTFQQQPRLGTETAVLPIPPHLFQPHTVNDLTIHLPDARRASYRDPTRLSLAIADITLVRYNPNADKP